MEGLGLGARKEGRDGAVFITFKLHTAQHLGTSVQAGTL